MDRYWVWENSLFGQNPKRPGSQASEDTYTVIKYADHRREVEAKDAVQAGLTKDVLALSQQIADLQEQLETAQAAQDVMWTRKGYLQSQVAQLQGQLEAERDVQKALTDIIAEERAKVAQLGNVVAEKEAQITALTEERDANMQGWTELDVICKQAINERDKLKADLTTLRGLVERLKDDVPRTKSDVYEHVRLQALHREIDATLAQAQPQLLKSTNSVEISSSAQPKGEQ